MMTNKTRITALITPVEEEAQNEAMALASQGHTARAVSRLRRKSELGLHVASVALDILAGGQSLPTSYDEGLANLRSLCPELVEMIVDFLGEGDTTSAVKFLREQTDMDLIGADRLVQQLSDHA
ncbi:hypothetical protein [Streptomyces cucumeris]|uniref:hypothetical protein n=1 Tax=Streptomyces cucumeris TaxID=2962890 RepID=UPI003D74842A